MTCWCVTYVWHLRDTCEQRGEVAITCGQATRKWSQVTRRFLYAHYDCPYVAYSFQSYFFHALNLWSAIGLRVLKWACKRFTLLRLILGSDVLEYMFFNFGRVSCNVFFFLSLFSTRRMNTLCTAVPRFRTPRGFFLVQSVWLTEWVWMMCSYV